MYPGNTHLKPVIGLDIHFVNIPFPCPLPHPYIGLVIDPFDYIPFIGATVKINGVPRGNTDTMGKIITFIHIPFGAGFTLPPIIGHDSQNFFGSKNVQVDGAPMSGAGYMLMTCNDIGLPLSLSPGKKFIPIPSLYLPTSFCIPLQWGPPVMVGGPLVPHFSLMALLKGFAFGSFLKVFGKIAGKLLAKLNHSLLKKFPSTQKLSAKFCKMGFEPVDLITGRVNYQYTDFEIPGPIPVRWTRNWDSDSRLTGSLGYKTHLCYDRYIQLFPEEEALALLLADGRMAAFPLLQPGDQFYHPVENITLSRKQNGHFLLTDHGDDLYYHFNYEQSRSSIFKLSFIEDYSGFRMQLHYTGRHLAAITDASGRKILCSLNRDGCITQVEIVANNQRQCLVKYDYTDQNDLCAVKDAMDQATIIVYNDKHLMTSKTDRNGQSFYWQYDDKMRCIHTWGDGGLLEGWIEYHAGYNIVTNSQQEQTIYYYNNANLCVQETDHYGNSRFTEYTEEGQLYREIDEEGNATGYTYHNNGQLKEIVRPDGAATVYNYNEWHQLIMISYPDGSTQTAVYDEQHRTSFINYANGHFNAYQYNEQGLIGEINSRGGISTKLLYDADANLSAVVFEDGSKMEWRFDAFGHCVEAIDTGGKRKYLQYDLLGRVTTLQLPDGNKVRLQYDAYEEVVKAADNHYAVAFEYTPLGNIKKRVQNNTAVEFHYDTEERLYGITNEAGKLYRFAYNKRGEITRETGFDGLEKSYRRDKAGRTIKTIRPAGKSSAFEYDVNGNIIRIEHHDGSWEVFDYDKNGHLTGAGNLFSSVVIQRNKLGLPQKETTDACTIESKYDQFGNRIQISSSLGANISIARNKQGLPASMLASFTTNKDNGLSAVWLGMYKYNLAGQEIEKILPGAIISERSYDAAGRPREHKITRNGNTLSWKKYSWDTNNRLTHAFDALGQSNIRFRHDAAGTLVWAQYADKGIVTRHADATGNLYRSEDASDCKYNNAGALLETATHMYKYDEEGNLLSRTQKVSGKKTSFEWYAGGLLASIKRPDGKEIIFKYDALGRRIEKCFDGKVYRYAWDGNTLLHEWAYNETERPLAFVDDLGRLVYDREEPLEDLTTWLYDPESYTPAAKIQGGRMYSIISDYLGTPVTMYDEHGNKVWEAALDIYGRSHMLVGNNADLPFRYQGQYEDIETGFYYNRFRYYDAATGRYISQDPIGVNGGLALYAYVTDTNFLVDIFGLVDGGSYGTTRASNTGGQTNHMPAHSASQNANSGISHYSGPATHMDTGDHFNTASWGSRNTSKEWRGVQEDLINRGKFGKAMEMDIRDVTRKFGSKYNKGMAEMVDYAIGKDFISAAEGRRMKRKYLKCK